MNSQTTNPGNSTDPLDALTKLVTAGDVEIFDRLRATFWGPQATFVQAATQAAQATEPKGVERFLECLTALDGSFARLGKKFTKSPQSWQRLRQLALLRVGPTAPGQQSGLAFSPQDLLESLGDPSDSEDTPAVFEGDSSATQYFGGAIDWLAAHGMRTKPTQGTAAYWRLVGLVHDARSADDSAASAGISRERTPIFLASESFARVLWLVAERLPGPPGLITPHWWRLGLAPLGDNDCLLRDIHHGFEAVLRGSSKTSCQFRWWLELHPGGEWHQRISEADSVQVSAACVARALLDTGAAHPLLDDKAGVSAILPAGDVCDLKRRPVGAVGRLPRKILAARQAGLRTFLTERDSVQLEWSDEGLRVPPIVTFDDAYQALLATAAVVQIYKQRKASQWDGFWIDTSTHQDFIDASQPESKR